jgi:hypothetical protein
MGSFRGVEEGELMSIRNGGITDISSNREPESTPSLFRTRHPVVPPCFLHQRFLDMLPPLLLKEKTRGMSGGHFESFTAINIHAVQNSIVSVQEGY